jgi:S1-C subfamily serine protease
VAIRQTDVVRDSVFPLVEVAPEDDGTAAFVRLLGTGFLLGAHGFALTAAHVLRDVPTSAFFVDEEGRWRGFPVTRHEVHPSEDVAVLQIAGGPWGSILTLGHTVVQATFPYFAWGYPDDVLWEVVEQGRAQPRPDLVFTAGYVRRRVRDLHLPKIKGSLLAELTTPAGSGCSGAPVLARPGPDLWEVVGLYLGERRSDDVQVGYAVLTDVFRDWGPSIVGRPLIDESREAPRLPTLGA